MHTKLSLEVETKVWYAMAFRSPEAARRQSGWGGGRCCAIVAQTSSRVKDEVWWAMEFRIPGPEFQLATRLSPCLETKSGPRWPVFSRRMRVEEVLDHCIPNLVAK